MLFKTEINSKINQTISEALVRVCGMLGASVGARRLAVGQSNRETNNDGLDVRSSAVKSSGWHGHSTMPAKTGSQSSPLLFCVVLLERGAWGVFLLLLTALCCS